MEFGQLLAKLTNVRTHRDNRPKGHIKEHDVYAKMDKDEMSLVHPVAEGPTKNDPPFFTYDD